MKSRLDLAVPPGSLVSGPSQLALAAAGVSILSLTIATLCQSACIASCHSSRASPMTRCGGTRAKMVNAATGNATMSCGEARLNFAATVALDGLFFATGGLVGVARLGKAGYYASKGWRAPDRLGELTLDGPV